MIGRVFRSSAVSLALALAAACAPQPSPAPPSPTPPSAPESPPPPSPVARRAIEDSGRRSDVVTCVVEHGQVREVRAQYEPATGDTVVGRVRPFAAVYRRTAEYGEGQRWFDANEPIMVHGVRYPKTGPTRTLAVEEARRLARHGEYLGVPVFRVAGDSVPSAGSLQLYVAVRPGCVFQTYARRTTVGDVADADRPRQVDLRICVVRGGELREVTARYDVASGDTTVEGSPFAEAFPASEGYAAGARWYVENEPIPFLDRRYIKYGLPRPAAIDSVRKVGEYRGVPVFGEVGEPDLPVLLLPVRPGCEFQQYQYEPVLRGVRG